MISILFYLYLAAAVVIGCLCARRIKTPDDYYVAGRRTGVIPLAGSLLATILGSSAILGSIDMASGKGWAGAWLLVCGALGLAALLPLVNVVAGFRGYNLSMLIGKFYGDTVKKLSGAVIAAAWLGVIGAQIIGAASSDGERRNDTTATGMSPRKISSICNMSVRMIENCPPAAV